MIVGALATADAVGAVLVHTLRAGERVLKKGRVLDASDVAALVAAGHAEIVGARLDAGDVGEDEAAAAVAAPLGGSGVRVDAAHTGRANLFAAVAGVVRIDRDAITRANAIDEAITVATTAPDLAVRAGDMIATVKIIPFAAATTAVARAADAARGAIAVVPWRGCRAGLVLTRTADTAERVLDRAAAAQRARMERCGGALIRELRVAHTTAEVAGALAALASDGLDPILALGASAIMDRNDVIPAAVVAAGGAIARLGMPVDPGNLLLLASLGGATVIGVPGCARSLRRSGFDWVLEQVCASIAVGGGELAALGVGGLLDEVAARPAPRDGSAPTPDRPVVGAIVLAAGRATRMGGGKLTALVDGVPIVRHVAMAALGSSARPVVVVTGDRAGEVAAALDGLDLRFAHNPDFAAGLSTSLRVGLTALGEVDGALVCLGDMPRLTAAHLDAVIAGFDPAAAGIVVPTCERKRGNPVLWARRYFAEMAALSGDVGARALIDRHAADVALVAVDDPAILLDVDTPESLAALTRDGGR